MKIWPHPKLDRFCFLALSFILFVFLLAPLRAEVVTDGSTGPVIHLTGPNYLISDSIGTRFGSNLFHSFDTFNLYASEKAVFSGPDTVRHVISRVTGGLPSYIDGILESSIPGADFYFINPAGMLFGREASINIGASVLMSTDDHIRFSDGKMFSSPDLRNTTFTAANPEAFGFLDKNPGKISINSNLSLSQGFDFTIVGGDITFSAATVNVSDGLLRMAATASKGEMPISDLSATDFNTMGTVLIDQGSVAVSRGATKSGIFIGADRLVIRESTVGTVNDGNGNTGNLTIRLTGSMELSDSSVLASMGYGNGNTGNIDVSVQNLSTLSGSSIHSYAAEAGNAGSIDLNVDETMIVSGQSAAGNSSRLMTLSDGTGGSGDITIQSQTLLIESEGRILNHHNADGYRGKIAIETDSIQLNSNGILMCADLDVEAGTMTLQDGAYIWGRPSLYDPLDPPLLRFNLAESLSIIGQGQVMEPWRDKTHPLYTGIHTDSFIYPKGSVGSIEIFSPLIAVSESGQISTRTNTGDPGGTVLIHTDNLILESGGQIAADSNGSSAFDGVAGNLKIYASNSIWISGYNGDLESGLFSTSRSRGNAGQIEVVTPDLTVGDGGIIQVGAGFFSSGEAGKIVLKTDRLRVLSGASIETYSEGDIGNGRIDIISKESIDINNGAILTSGDWDSAAGDIYMETPVLNLVGGIISASMLEDAWKKAGNIILNADQITLEANSQIRAFSLGWGDAGSILMNAGTVSLFNSSITTETVSSDGGNIALENKEMTLLNLVNSQITTSVSGGLGNGGNILIEKPQFVVLKDSQIIANAFEGAGGNIQINTGQLIEDPESRIEASSQKGIDGRIDIQSPDIDISGSISVLPEAFLDAAAVMKHPCDVKTMGNSSSLVSTGFAFVPITPDDPLQSVYLGTGVRE